jgi:hypothetical protein
MLAERLNMDKEAAEKWITGLILSARLNAKIDSKAGTVVMGVQTSSIQVLTISVYYWGNLRLLASKHSCWYVLQ